MSYINKSYLLDTIKNFKTVVLDPLFAKKLDNTTNASNAGKAVVVDNSGNLTFGDAGVQVSEADGNAIETKTDGIFVAESLEIVEKTKAEYAALPEAEKNDATKIYRITDETSSKGDASLVSYGSSTVKVALDKTTVNILKPTLATTSSNGVSCTSNGDGTYTLNGTATAQSYFTLQSSMNLTIEEDMKCVSMPVDVHETYVRFVTSTSETYDSKAKQFPIIPKNSIIDRYVLVCNAGTSYTNAIIKPMLTTNTAATYDDFVAYTGDTGKLNGDVAEIQSKLPRVLIKQSYTGAQTITLPDNDFDYIECYFRIMGGNTQVLPTVKIARGEMGACFLTGADANISQIRTYERRVTLSSDGLSLTFGECVINYYNGSYGTTKNNEYMTLEKVVACKYGA